MNLTKSQDTEQVKTLRDELSRLSGGGKRLSKNRTSGLYASINLPDFEDMRNLRDTTIRYLDYGIKTLEGLSLVEFGSNMGALSWEALNLGAVSVRGYEYNTERVEWCNKVAKLYNLDAEFTHADFNLQQTLTTPTHQGDVVFACSVDEYLTDRDGFARLVANATLDTCYFESNIQDRSQTLKVLHARLINAGFKKVTYHGDGESGGNARRRKLFICKK